MVVPTRDRPESLTRCLAALAAQTWPRDCFEVVVVDDGSRIPPAGIVAAWKPRLDARLVPGPGRGPGAARNAGARVARGTLLALTDDDCTPVPAWIERLVARWVPDPTTGVGGRTPNGLADSLYAEASQLLQDYVYSYYNRNPDDARFFATNNLLLPADPFRRIGGFDESFGRTPSEDRDLCDRWLAAGHRLRYAPDAVVVHNRAMGWPGFARQHWRYGEGAWWFRRLRRGRGRSARRWEPPSFYVGMMRHPFRVGSRSPARLAGLILVSQAASTAGFLARAARERVRGSR